MMMAFYGNYGDTLLISLFGSGFDKMIEANANLSLVGGRFAHSTAKRLGYMKDRMETLEEKVARVIKEEVAVVPYDPRWLAMFEEERRHLLSCLPRDLVRRIEHFGSTSVPGLAAKPIVDILVEVTRLDETKQRIVPVLETQGYEYFWRPSWGDGTPPFYAWIKFKNSKPYPPGTARSLPSLNFYVPGGLPRHIYLNRAWLSKRL